MDLTPHVHDLAVARALREKTKSQLEALENAFRASKKYVTLKAIDDKAKERLESADGAVRLAAEQAYREFKEKDPHPAVSIAMRRVVTIGDGALAFAQAHVPKAVIVDTKVFTKAVLAFTEAGVDVPPDAATVEETPQVRVKTDLSEFAE